MDIQEHYTQFQHIIKKHKLDQKADELADYITGEKNVCPKEFAKIFSLSEQEAHIVLSWIQKGLSFKEDQLKMN